MTKLLTWLRARWRWVAAGLAAAAGLIFWWRRPALRGFLADDDPTPVDLPKPLTPEQGAEAKAELGKATQAQIDKLHEENEKRKAEALAKINRPMKK